jgi:hypothetical protein
MLRQYYAGRWFAPSSNPLRVGPIRVGSIYRLPSMLHRARQSNAPLKWIVVAFRNGVYAAACREHKTGFWQDRFISGRSDTAVIQRLADGFEMEISVSRLLCLDDEQGGTDYPDLPDVQRFHRHYRVMPHQEAA